MLESCDCELDAKPDRTECRVVFRLNCRQGVVKTYRLFYESGEILHATFDKVGSVNHWTVSSRTLRDVVEYFGPKTDQLDWFYQQGKVTFTSYTEKIQSGRGELTSSVVFFVNNFRNPETTNAHFGHPGTQRL